MKTTISVVVTAVAVTALAATAAAQPAPPKKETVQFARGASEATIKGALQGDQTIDYHVSAGAGQTLAVTMKASNASTYFNVLPPGSNDVAMFVGSTEGSTYKGMLPDDGAYVVRVYLMRAVARRNEKSDYTLTIGVTGKPLAPLAASRTRWSPARASMPPARSPARRRSPWSRDSARRRSCAAAPAAPPPSKSARRARARLAGSCSWPASRWRLMRSRR